MRKVAEFGNNARMCQRVDRGTVRQVEHFHPAIDQVLVRALRIMLRTEDNRSNVLGDADGEQWHTNTEPYTYGISMDYFRAQGYQFFPALKRADARR